MMHNQLSLGGLSPADEWERGSAQRALDDLFSMAHRYRSGREYHDLVRFVAQFRFYSPFNAMLVHMQMPGATYVAPPYRWYRDYRRTIKAGARPLVILQPMGPVMLVFDVSDTEPLEGAPSLPSEVERPFEVRHGSIGGELDRTVENAKRDGVGVSEQVAGPQSAGEIRSASRGHYLRFQVKCRPDPEYAWLELRYEVLLNANHSAEAKYATLVHELGHLYCGHLGTPNAKWWPDRRGLDPDVCEFEAESICYLVCTRLGIDNPSYQYLAPYTGQNADVPPISLDCVMRTAGLIEQMGRVPLKLRKE